MNTGMREKILEKLIEFFEQLPDGELEHEMGDGEMSETPEMEGEKPKGKIEIMSMEAKPAPKGLADKLKGC